MENNNHGWALCKRNAATRQVLRMMFREMPDNKLLQYKKACDINFGLTSEDHLHNWSVSVYKEGFRVTAEGCRSSFAAYARDDDGELVFERKPAEKTMHLLWSGSVMDWDYDLETAYYNKAWEIEKAAR